MTTYTFNAVTGRSLVRALASLTASTRLTVAVGGVEFTGEGLNSPYRSHQRVTGSPTAGPGLNLVNDSWVLAVGGPFASAPAGMEWHEGVVPVAAVSAAAARLAAIVPGLGALLAAHLPSGSPLVAVGVLLPALAGWDEDGRPLFAEGRAAVSVSAAPLAGITEAMFSPEDEPPAPADDDPEPEPEPGPTLRDAIDGLTLTAQSLDDVAARAAAAAAGARAVVARFGG